ncbi:MAG: hypothetical protein WC061_05590 [Melioribacteraceae bacterium]
MKKIILELSFVLLFISQSNAAPGEDWKKKESGKFSLCYTERNINSIQEYENILINGIEAVENYFGFSFKAKFEVYLFPSRSALDEQWSRDWNSPGFRSECWMVASGVAHRLDLLSLNRWKAEACEHNAEDMNHVRKILTHELVHVFHAQNNPVPDFSGLDKIGWYIEGLAVLVSGQMDIKRKADLITAEREGLLPSKLAGAWSGKYRYAVSGSLIEFIEKRYGKEIIIKILVCKTNSEILEILNLDEEKLINGWKNSIKTASSN